MTPVTPTLMPCVPFWNEISATLTKGPFLGVDWGQKWTGLAISDEHGQLAMPLKVVPSGGALRHVLVALWRDHGIQALILGWPLHLDGRQGSLCPTILRLAQRLIQDHGWSVGFWDERLSSQGGCAASPFSPSTKGKRMDHHAAAFILQGALDQWRIAHV